jgi:hypothetical protein
MNVSGAETTGPSGRSTTDLIPKLLSPPSPPPAMIKLPEPRRDSPLIVFSVVPLIRVSCFSANASSTSCLSAFASMSAVVK